MYIVVLLDACFASNSDYRSQLGFIVRLMDHKNFCNIVHDNSVKWIQVVRSVLDTELHVFVFGFDHGYKFRAALKCILNRNIPMEMFTDSKCLFMH